MIVIGVGNRDRGDDAVGPLVVDRLGSTLPCFESNGDPSALISLFDRDSEVIIVDAMVTGGAPGSISSAGLAEAGGTASELSGHGSTHGFGVLEALELARALGALPPRVTLVGVEASSFEPGSGLSPELEPAIERTVDLILRWSEEPVGSDEP